MWSSIFHLFHQVLAPSEADADPASGLKQSLACLPARASEALAANDHLRGFLIAVVRHHEEGRVAQDEWSAVAHFLTGRQAALPPSVAHLGGQWPGVRDTSAVLAGLWRSDGRGVDESPENTIARFQALLAHLKAQARGESWLSHGFKVEFQAMCEDPAFGPLDRIEVVDLAVLKLGPMDGEQLRACVERIARLQRLLPEEVYPCIHDALTRISNEASWQLDLFGLPEDPLPPAAQRCGMSLAE